LAPVWPDSASARFPFLLGFLAQKPGDNKQQRIKDEKRKDKKENTTMTHI
jgi:hypothetical protein